MRSLRRPRVQLTGCRKSIFFYRKGDTTIIHESTGAAETFLAHQLPDKYNAMATPIGLLVLLLVFDWRLGLLSLVPVALGFVIMSAMTGRRMADKMRQYGNALESMSNEAVEYVRGIPVVKTFGQSVFSFKKFKATMRPSSCWTRPPPAWMWKTKLPFRRHYPGS